MDIIYIIKTYCSPYLNIYTQISDASSIHIIDNDIDVYIVNVVVLLVCVCISRYTYTVLPWMVAKSCTSKRMVETLYLYPLVN